MSIKTNIGANFVGNIWTGVLALLFAPLYIHFMGIESYGLVGIYTMLLGVFSLLDMGLGSTLNRELARLSVRSRNARLMRNLLHTIEIPYWGVGILLGGGVGTLSGIIAEYWIQPDALSVSTVRNAVLLMGCAIVFQWPIGIYTGGLMGMQRHVLFNVINMLFATARGVGALVGFLLVAPTVEVFFAWQALISIIHVYVMRRALWHSIPYDKAQLVFSLAWVRRVWRFAAGVTGITIAATLFQHLDAVILSRLLSLENFGAYALAKAFAVSLSRLVIPISNSVYPRLTQCYERKNWNELKGIYHKAAQLLSSLVLPTTIVVALFSYEILFLWTRKEELATSTAGILSMLIIAKAANGMIQIPYILQLAFGWLRFMMIVNIAVLLTMIPLMLLLVHFWGAHGAALAMLCLHVGCLFLCVAVVHRFILQKEGGKWFVYDFFLPGIAALGVGLAGRFLVSKAWSSLTQALWLGSIGITALTASLLASRDLGFYRFLMNQMSAIFGKQK